MVHLYLVRFALTMLYFAIAFWAVSWAEEEERKLFYLSCWGSCYIVMAYAALRSQEPVGTFEVPAHLVCWPWRRGVFTLFVLGFVGALLYFVIAGTSSLDIGPIMMCGTGVFFSWRLRWHLPESDRLDWIGEDLGLLYAERMLMGYEEGAFAALLCSVNHFEAADLENVVDMSLEARGVYPWPHTRHAQYQVSQGLKMAEAVDLPGRDQWHALNQRLLARFMKSAT